MQVIQDVIETFGSFSTILFESFNAEAFNCTPKRQKEDIAK